MAPTRPRAATPSRRPARGTVDPRRLLALLALAAVTLIVVGQHLPDVVAARLFVPQSAVSGVPKPSPSPERKTARPVAATGAGTSGKFAYVAGFGPVLGGKGTIRRFKVAVELPSGTAVGTSFADEINRVLGDKRSWIAGQRFRFQRVPHSARAEFVIYLASARTSQRMCRIGGLETDGYTSCRLPRQVIINDVRWQRAVPGYGASLEVYRAYAINHEVGHQLGYGHETCPAKGRPAPVMMQQTYGLKGCAANAWPHPTAPPATHGRTEG
ncbi:MAG: DUF3152 domain-containing protein [Actinoplanes sp.]